MKRVICSTGEIVESYTMYLRTKHWRKKREEFLKSDYYDHKCSMCSVEAPIIHIHHITYKNIGNERLLDLIAVCGECHTNLHKNEDNAFEGCFRSPKAIKRDRVEMLKRKVELGMLEGLGVKPNLVGRANEKNNERRKRMTKKNKMENEQWLAGNDKKKADSAKMVTKKLWSKP